MTEHSTNRRYCQSCGMPLRFDVAEWLGTDSDGTKSNQFCYYCLKDGHYTVDISMQEMIGIWVKYTDKYNMYAATAHSPEELRAILSRRLPGLKRWKQKQDTNTIHHRAIRNVILYINNHLSDALDTDRLCAQCGLSKFHFRRVFRTVTGENTGSYIQRLRMELVAHLLISTEYTLTQIAAEINYQTKFSVAKAFKKHFGLSTSRYRELYKPSGSLSSIVLSPEIRSIDQMRVFCLEVGEAYKNKFQYKLLWDKLLYYAGEYGADKRHSRFASLSFDDPSITPAARCRFYLGFITGNDPKKNAAPDTMQIPSGLYAVFRHTGSYESLCNLYRAIYETWFPASGYRPQSTFSFEIYINTPASAQITDLITDIYIPIARK